MMGIWELPLAIGRCRVSNTVPVVHKQHVPVQCSSTVFCSLSTLPAACLLLLWN